MCVCIYFSKVLHDALTNQEKSLLKYCDYTVSGWIHLTGGNLFVYFSVFWRDFVTPPYNNGIGHFALYFYQ